MMSENKKCACKGDNLDRFIQPIVLLILMEEDNTGYGILKKMSGFSMFRDSRPDATGVYRYLRNMTQRGLLEQYEYKEADNKYKMKYRITQEGKDCLSNWENTLCGYAESIMELVTFIQKSRK